MSLDFYDSLGNPVAYTDDGEHIFTFPGQPVAYLNSGSVYSFSGAHLGWLEDGQVRDHGGAVVFFTPEAAGGPLKPLRKLKPVKGLKQLNPLKGIRQFAPLKPLTTLSWSQLSGLQFFQ